ncbi:DUF6969 family protein [Hydrogenophilus thermoluteolus]|uniref:DUF6969 family protein n=1 Tax=Hydrogenophilus thermoluteolus TaxID=297 RepID=UPI003F681D3B
MTKRTHTPRPLWHPLVAGVALGVTLVFTFLLTGNGLGASGAFARTAAWLGGESAKTNAYLSAFWQSGHPLNNWIVWVVVGVILGALLSAINSGRFRWKLEGAAAIGAGKRIATAFVGGVLAGFGSRVAAGCTSGLGLSGGATLAVSAFVLMDAWGRPISLFLTNRWVTDETWVPAHRLLPLVNRFAVTHAYPNWAANIWLTTFIRAVQPWIVALLRARDARIAAHLAAQPELLEDRSVEVIVQMDLTTAWPALAAWAGVELPPIPE